MDGEIGQLEQAWIEAETRADHIRELALEAERIAEELKLAAGRNGSEVNVLLTKAEQLHARHLMAERSASEAFDRLWHAKGQG
ncbi:MAG: hypothetical protein R3D27_09700 [Hyphomicrobiaceae bacterium]